VIWLGILIGAASVIILEVLLAVGGLVWFAVTMPDDHNPYVDDDAIARESRK
jgi:hypothetical protein